MNKVITLLLYIAPFYVVAEESREAQIERFAQGNYFLVGKHIDSKETYYGEVSITKEKSGLSVVRTIAGKMVKGTAAVEHATADKLPVLRIRFSDAGNDYEETCMVDSDLDNYARITCHLYIPGKKIMEPGMEAYFINFNKSL
jgi:hypothetical protein